MKKWVSLAVAAALIGFAIWFMQAGPKPKENLQVIRIGWQTPLATQGQIVQVLKNSDILERNGFKAEFVEFSFGSPQVEAAAAGKLDVIFVGDQPALNLVAKGAPWKLTSELFETRVGLMVPPGSSLKPDQLKGKTVASPFGSVAHREAMFFARNAGIDLPSDVNNVSIDILEIASLVKSRKPWGKIDAVAVWEPSVTLFTSQGLATPIAEAKTLGVVAASDAFLATGNSADRLNKVVSEAWQFLLQNPKLANDWYIEDSKQAYTNDYLMQALKLDRNGSLLPAPGTQGRADSSKVSIAFTDQDLCTLQRGLKWAKDQGLVKVVPPAQSFLYGHKQLRCLE
jgi:ABC-type nitrate/sulfonate/bicarbonate transport system substrate-binding protein